MAHPRPDRCALLFGARRLPDAARGLGRSRIFKAETKGLTESSEPKDETLAVDGADKAPPSAQAATEQPAPEVSKQTPTQN